MDKVNVKELIAVILFAVINAAVAFVITGMLGITNVVLVQGMSSVYGTITYEVIIFFILSFIQAIIYDRFQKSRTNEK